MGISNEEIKQADDALKVAAGEVAVQEVVLTPSEDPRVSGLAQQVVDLTERLRQVESFINRKYPYG